MPAAPNFGEFDKLIKLAGLAGTSISILKAAVIYIADHSLDRKARKIGDEIDKDLARLARLDNPNLDLPPVHLELYKNQINEDLQAQLRALDRARSSKLRRVLSKNADPTGIARWLLLYKPAGVNGWFIHTSYYCTLLLVALFLVDLCVIAFFDTAARDLEFLGAMAACFVLFSAIALYLRSISLRLKTKRNSIILHAIPHPNFDLYWLRQLFLLFKRHDGYWILRICSWFCVVELIAFPWIIEDEGYSFEMVFSGLFFVFLVWLFHTDALSRRAKKRLPTLLASAEHPSPAPADLPSTFPAPST